MNPDTAGDAGNYDVDWTSTRKIKRRLVTVYHPIGVLSATFHASNNSVTLATSSTPQTFEKGGLITITAAPPSGISTAAGVFLAKPTRFIVPPRAGGIAPSG
jgi:hypothetical protein